MRCSRMALTTVAATLFWAQTAQAATFTCIADPKAYLAVSGDGLVWTGIDNGTNLVITAICSLTGNDGAASPQSCSAWYAMMLTAKGNGTKLLPHFNSAQSSNASASGCSSFSHWQHHELLPVSRTRG